MKPWLIMAVTLLCTGISCAQRKVDETVPPALESQLKKFFVEKRLQAQALAKVENKEPMPAVWGLFAAGEKGDWNTVASIYSQLRKGPRLETMVWQPVKECFFGYQECATFSEGYVTNFVREILDSMPRGSIYFGGTAGALDLPVAFSQSHVKADPCFILCQNALADNLYLQYLQAMYGDRLKLPSTNDSRKVLDEYTQDAGQRLKAGKLAPGEDVKEVDGKVRVAGQFAVIALYGRLAQLIFEANPRQEFFIAETFPLDWMYPYLEPHGLIMKLNRQPPEQIPDDLVQKDGEYWTRFINGALGPWLTATTSVEVVCAFAQSVFARHEQERFQPDERFVRNSDACKTYSKLRGAQAGVYAWRTRNSKSPEEKQRMEDAADFAFRQAFALCPSNAETLYRYVSVLVEQKRFEDARRLAKAAQILEPGASSYQQLLKELNQLEDNTNKRN